MPGPRSALAHAARCTRKALLAAALSSVVITGAVEPASAAPSSPISDSAAAEGETVARINFQPSGATIPAGYTVDVGAAFTTATGYGWEDSTGAPLSLVGNARERKVAADQRLDTFIHMQLPAAISGVHAEGRWERVLPNGTYDVSVGVGDPSYTDSRNVIRLEGKAIGTFSPTAGNTNTIFTASVTVIDGRLTLDAVGGKNTKLDFVDITIPSDSAPPRITVTSDDALGLGSRLVLSTIAGEARPGRALTITNNGTVPVDVSGITFSGAQPQDFKVDPGTPATFTLSPGASRSITVLFRPTTNAATTGAAYVAQALMTINSNDPGRPSYQVSLGGLSSENYEGFREPDLKAVSDALGYSTDVVVPNKPVLHSIGPSTAAIGDEVLAPYFTRVDASKPVTLLPVAHYSGKTASDSTSFGWFPKASSSFNSLYRFPGGTSTGNANKGYGENQLLMPKQTTAANTFNPTTAFGIFDGQGNRTDDALVPNGKWHNFRTYPAKRTDGSVVPNTWLLGDDIGSPQNNPAKNWDYQDYAFVLTNAAPDSSSTQPVGGVLDRTLLFNGSDGGSGGTGFTTANGSVELTKVSVSAGRLRMETNSNTNDSHVNALALPVNAGSKLRIQSRLVGPFDALDAGNEQQGIFFGPSATAYLKAEVEAVNGVRNLTIWRNDTKTIVARTPLPGGDATKLDLRIDLSAGDSTSSSPYANIYYAIDGAAFVKLNTALISLPNGYFTTTTFGGVVASHQGGGSPFTAMWEDFAVTRR